MHQIQKQHSVKQIGPKTIFSRNNLSYPLSPKGRFLPRILNPSFCELLYELVLPDGVEDQCNLYKNNLYRNNLFFYPTSPEGRFLPLILNKSKGLPPLRPSRWCRRPM